MKTISFRRFGVALLQPSLVKVEEVSNIRYYYTPVSFLIPIAYSSFPHSSESEINDYLQRLMSGVNQFQTGRGRFRSTKEKE